MAEKTLWNYFNLAENNPDQDGGILYCLRYDEDRISAHRTSVVGALESMGIGLKEVDEIIYITTSGVMERAEQYRVRALLEELSCLNEAMEYTEAGFNQFSNVRQLKNGLMSAYFGLLEEREMADAYNIVTVAIPQIVGDLTLADCQSGVLSASERRELAELTRFAKRQDDLLNTPGGFVIVG